MRELARWGVLHICESEYVEIGGVESDTFLLAPGGGGGGWAGGGW